MTLRIGLIGCGGIVNGHIMRLRETGEAEIAAMQDPSAAAMDALVQRHGLDGVPRFADHQEMLAAGGVDAVLISSPHTHHYQQTVDALDAGMHVLLEKPMACSVAEANLLVERVKRSDRVVMLSYQRHYESVYRYARQLVASGELGRLSYVQAFLSQEWMQGTEGTWRQMPELGGGGELLDSGSHICDMLLYIPGQQVESVSARVDFRGRPVDINTGAVLQYQDGAIGTLTIVGDAGGWWEDWTINGDKGTLFIRGGRVWLKRYREPIMEVERGDMPVGSNPDRAFVDAIAGRAANETPVEIGVGVIRLTEAIWRSGAAGGAPVTV